MGIAVLPQPCTFPSHEVAILDSLIRRHWDNELGIESLTPISSTGKRLQRWYELTGKAHPLMGDATTPSSSTPCAHSGPRRHRPLRRAAAPSSMIDREHAVLTQVNNVVGTLNLLYAIRDECPDCHLVKSALMGEYGTPNIDIEEGYITVEYKGAQRYPALPQAARFLLSPLQGARQPQHHVRLPHLGICAPPI